MEGEFLLPRSIAIFIVIAAAMFATGCGARSDDTAAGLITADSYRNEIRAIEVILYQSTPADFSDIDRAAVALHDLHQAIVEREPSPQARGAANDLLFLSARADVSGIGYAAPSLREVRTQWERTRTELFGEVAWFLTATPDVVSGQTP